jgi:hypothetical protein
MTLERLVYMLSRDLLTWIVLLPPLLSVILPPLPMRSRIAWGCWILSAVYVGLAWALGREQSGGIGPVFLYWIARAGLLAITLSLIFWYFRAAMKRAMPSNFFRNTTTVCSTVFIYLSVFIGMFK